MSSRNHEASSRNYESRIAPSETTGSFSSENPVSSREIKPRTMQACAVISGKAVALGGLMHTAQLNGGGDRAMKRQIEEIRKRLAEQRRLRHHNRTQH